MHQAKTCLLTLGVLTAGWMLGGCSSGQGSPGRAVSPLGVFPSTTGNRVTTAHQPRVKSWMNPAAATGRLLYVADPFANAVLVYAYPQLSGAGELTGFTSVNGVCTDSRGYIWVLDTSDVVVEEFAHGGTAPINTLHPAGDSTGNPGVGEGCAVNPKNGDLAVVGAGPGITVFRNGQNTQATYWDFNFEVPGNLAYAGYDNTNNLYVDGDTSSFAFGLTELASGSPSLSDVTLTGGSILAPGGIAWDGKNLDIADARSGNLYQTNGSAILNTIVTTAQCQGQFYIHPNHNRFVDPDPCSASAGVYAYPSGGSPIKTANGGMQEPTGVAISAPGG